MVSESVSCSRICEVVQEREAHVSTAVRCVSDWPHAGRTNHRLQLLPLGSIQEPVTPLLKLLRE